MTERQAIIESMSNPELLMFHAAGGLVPLVMWDRLARLLAQSNWELALPAPQRVPRPKIGPAVVYPQRRKHRAKRAKMVKRRYREAA